MTAERFSMDIGLCHGYNLWSQVDSIWNLAEPFFYLKINKKRSGFVMLCWRGKGRISWPLVSRRFLLSFIYDLGLHWLSSCGPWICFFYPKTCALCLQDREFSVIQCLPAVDTKRCWFLSRSSLNQRLRHFWLHLMSQISYDSRSWNRKLKENRLWANSLKKMLTGEFLDCERPRKRPWAQRNRFSNP